MDMAGIYGLVVTKICDELLMVKISAGGALPQKSKRIFSQLCVATASLANKLS